MWRTTANWAPGACPTMVAAGKGLLTLLMRLVDCTGRLLTCRVLDALSIGSLPDRPACRTRVSWCLNDGQPLRSLHKRATAALVVHTHDWSPPGYGCWSSEIGVIVFQIRIHGRGGQGVVTAAEMLSVAAFREGRHAQAFPSFGSERMGAPVLAFCRIDDSEIRSREPVAEPDALIIQDPTLLHAAGLFDGLAPQGYVILNTSRSLDELGIGHLVGALPPGHVRTVGATELALTHIGRPIPNAILLAAFAAVTGAIGLEAVLAAIREKVPSAVGEKNVAAAVAAYEALWEKESVAC